MFRCSRGAANALPLAGLIALAAVSLAAAARAAAPAGATPDGPFLRRPDIHGDTVVFTTEGDLWVGSIASGTAHRVTNAPGVETEAHFSPDGTTLAFTGQYDGGRDVYVMPVSGGSPKRLTWDPSGVRVVGWTPDGKGVLFLSARDNPERRRRLWRVPAEGGMPELLPIPWVAHASMDADGRRVAYVPISAEWQHWKRYTAGQADDIWLTDTKARTFRRLTTDPSIDTTPTWAGGQIYFVSERSGNANLYRLDPQSGAATALTHYTTNEVRYPSSDGKRVIFQHGDGLGLYDPATNTATDLAFHFPTDQIHARTRRVPLTNQIDGTAVGPTGKRLFVVSRGQIVSVPAKEGDVRFVAVKPGTRSQDPAWSPDGTRIAFVSDRSGEEEVWVAPAEGPGAPRQLTKDHKGPLGRLVWSPDGKRLATSDRSMRLFLVDAKTGAMTLVDQFDRGGSYDTTIDSYLFSPDGKWLAYTRLEPNWQNAVYLYDIATKTKAAISQPGINSWNPAFDPEGKFLYFLQDRSFTEPRGTGPTQFFGFDKTTRVSFVTLAADTKSPFLLKSDEEGAPADAAKKEAPKKETPKKEASQKDAKDDPKLPKMTVDLDGIAQRIGDIPVPADRYFRIDPVKDRLLLLVGGDPDNPGSGNSIRAFNMKDPRKKELKTIASGIDGYEVSADRTKALVRKDRTYTMLDTSADAMKDDDRVDLSGIQLVVDPRAEWNDIFNEAWRITRDFFYDPAMHGVDWEAVRVKYAKKLPSVGDRSELNDIIGDMLAELSTGHAYVGGGDLTNGATPQPMGYLGADFEPVPGADAVRITKLLHGDGYDLSARSPLLAPGLNVKEGDYILSVAGQPVRHDQDIQALLVGTPGRTIALTVNDKPVAKGARTVLVKPLASESTLRYYEWVNSRRAYVRQYGGPNLGYVHIPDMGDGGLTEFTKHYYPIVADKDGIIYDIRYNGGGYIASMLLMQMAFKPINYFKPRYGASWTYEGWAFRGYSAALCNDQDYSDAEYFVDVFQKLKLGPVIGTVTGGGLVGSGGGYSFLDGGKIWVPNYAAWSPDGQWVVEGRGATPDETVPQDPGAVLAGRDPQLDAAIAYLKKELREKPLPKLAPPSYPDKAGPAVASR